LETPEQVTQDEASGFLDWIRADFRAFEKRQKLRAVKKNGNKGGERA
jgi:hypothetical protein